MLLMTCIRARLECVPVTACARHNARNHRVREGGAHCTRRSCPPDRDNKSREGAVVWVTSGKRCTSQAKFAAGFVSASAQKLHASAPSETWYWVGMSIRAGRVCVRYVFKLFITARPTAELPSGVFEILPVTAYLGCSLATPIFLCDRPRTSCQRIFSTSTRQIQA
ncbi:hypothetical protein SCHPADRAFT_283996 [Schizopora paradoxa]|uniref:Uncharacterized protein n=1 Tax=Schizopora paradoxa TaxID=27342 RepID=A0A0H2RTX0_9AGAM|nr:hypothetical protein SCHPADRAFT_283996 [Schizopora paradoxa]